MICQNTAYYALVRLVGMAKTGPPRDQMSKLKASRVLKQTLMHIWVNDLALAFVVPLFWSLGLSYDHIFHVIYYQSG